jgi:phage gp36-like protein
MPYCTEQDLIDAFGEDELIRLTDRDSIGAIDSAVLARAQSSAEGEIDGYLISRFGAPVNPAPKVLVRICCDITRYYLYDDMATDQVTKRYDDAVKFLKAVAKGELHLGVDGNGDKPASSNLAQMETGGHVFGRDDSGFM